MAKTSSSDSHHVCTFWTLVFIGSKSTRTEQEKTLMYVLGTKKCQVKAGRPKACFNKYYEIKNASYLELKSSPVNLLSIVTIFKIITKTKISQTSSFSSLNSLACSFLRRWPSMVFSQCFTVSFERVCSSCLSFVLASNRTFSSL